MSKKILNLIQGYHPARGGAELFMKNLSEYQVNNLGYEVDVWTTNVLRPDQYWNIKEDPIEPAIEVIDGVNVRRFTIGKWFLKNRFINKVFSIIFSHIPEFHVANLTSHPTCYDMLDIVNSDELKSYDVVTVSATPYYFLFYVGYLISKKLDIPLVIAPALHIGVKNDKTLARKYLKKTALPFFQHAKKIILNTEVEGDAIREFADSHGVGIGKDRFLVTGQGVFLDKIMGGDGEKFRKKYGAKYPIVFQVGSKNEEKGSYDLVEAMKTLWDKGMNINLVFAGMPNPEFQKYLDKQNKYEKWIINIDNISEEDKWNLFDAGSVFSMVSKTDSFGIVYLEAWSYGVPVIGCNTEVIKQVVSNGQDGFLIEFGDFCKLSEKIEELLDNDNLRKRMGDAGRQKVENKYDWNKNLAKLGEMYEKL
jgi:glycosyltransferase involved in cell wall biosynthesis